MITITISHILINHTAITGENIALIIFSGENFFQYSHNRAVSHDINKTINIGQKATANHILTNLKILTTISNTSENINVAVMANLILITKRLSIYASGLFEL